MTGVFYVPLRKYGGGTDTDKSQHTNLTLEKKILPPLLPGFELATFRSRVRRSNQQAIPAPTSTHVFLALTLVTWQNSSSYLKEGFSIFLTRNEVHSIPGSGVGLEQVVGDSVGKKSVHLVRPDRREGIENAVHVCQSVTRSHEGVLDGQRLLAELNTKHDTLGYKAFSPLKHAQGQTFRIDLNRK